MKKRAFFKKGWLSLLTLLPSLSWSDCISERIPEFQKVIDRGLGEFSQGRIHWGDHLKLTHEEEDLVSTVNSIAPEGDSIREILLQDQRIGDLMDKVRQRDEISHSMKYGKVNKIERESKYPELNAEEVKPRWGTEKSKSQCDNLSPNNSLHQPGKEMCQCKGEYGSVVVSAEIEKPHHVRLERFFPLIENTSEGVLKG